MLQATQFFKCLADATRLNALLLIHQEGELCVCELMVALDDSQPKVSRHLAQLRNCGLLQDRRRGQWVYYDIHPQLPPWARAVIEQTGLANPEPLQLARQKLAAMKDRPSCCT